MWHEARKQEKKIREVMVDFQKRAERRREHYEKTRVDPSFYLRIIGTKCPVHLDPTGGKLDNSSMIPWQGDADNMISRYDVRVHMDYIPDYSKLPSEELGKEEQAEENKCNYERYRSLVHHTFRGENEGEVLDKLQMEDIFSDIQKKKINKDKKKVSKSKAAIGFDYDEGVGVSSSFVGGGHDDEVDEDDSSDDEYKMDFDVDELSTRQIDRLNVMALDYGISRGFYSKSLRTEKNMMLERKDAKIMEMEKSALSGKKARKERRLFKDMMLRERGSTPPLYLSRNSPTYEPYHGEEDRRSSSSSCSSSPDGKTGAMEYITEFGAESSSAPPKPSSSSHRTSRGSRWKKRSPSYSPPRRSSRDHYRARSRSRSRERRHRHRDHHHYSSSSHDRDRSHDYSPRHRSRSRSRSPTKITKNKLISKKATPSSSVKQKTDKVKLTPQERLKKKMQAQLSKTFKEDKKAERQKAVAKEAKEMEREEHLKEETRKLRERERHRLGDVCNQESRSPSPYSYRY